MDAVSIVSPRYLSRHLAGPSQNITNPSFKTVVPMNIWKQSGLTDCADLCGVGRSSEKSDVLRSVVSST